MDVWMFDQGTKAQLMTATPQAKLFAATFVVGFVAELVGEIALSSTIAEGQHTLKTRFWARYVVTAACAVLVGLVGYIVVNVLAHAGWRNLAWLLALIPSTAILSTAFVLQGVNTVLDGTSGVGCLEMISAAFRSKGCDKKSVCKG